MKKLLIYMKMNKIIYIIKKSMSTSDNTHLKLNKLLIKMKKKYKRKYEI